MITRQQAGLVINYKNIDELVVQVGIVYSNHFLTERLTAVTQPVDRISCILMLYRKNDKKKMAKILSPTNIIFLDVDGVLNNMAYLKGKDIGDEIDMRTVKHLADIYEECDCQIINMARKTAANLIA